MAEDIRHIDITFHGYWPHPPGLLISGKKPAVVSMASAVNKNTVCFGGFTILGKWTVLAVHGTQIVDCSCYLVP